MNLREMALDAAQIELDLDDEGDVAWACTPLPYDHRAHRYVVTAAMTWTHAETKRPMISVHTVLVAISMMNVSAERLASTDRELP